MYKKPKKEFPIKYMRKGLFSDDDTTDEKPQKKGERHIKKHKFSVHEKTRADGRKTK